MATTGLEGALASKLFFLRLIVDGFADIHAVQARIIERVEGELNWQTAR